MPSLPLWIRAPAATNASAPHDASPVKGGSLTLGRCGSGAAALIHTLAAKLVQVCLRVAPRKARLRSRTPKPGCVQPLLPLWICAPTAPPASDSPQRRP